MRAFESLGLSIARHWAKADFDNQRLPDIASEALAADRPWERVAYEEIVEWMACADLIPVQANLHSRFGQPPVTLYWHPRFYVEALFWTTGTTAIHQHRFSGAFAVLTGSSLQSRYTFSTRTRVSAHLLLGDLALLDVRLLHKGDIQPIVSGRALIHSVFHLDVPSVTLVVRTTTDNDSGVQYQFRRPHLAIDSFLEDAGMMRRLQALELAARLQWQNYEELALRSLESSDLLTTYWVLHDSKPIVDGLGKDFGRLTSRARARHGSRVDLLLPVIAEAQREAILISRREKIRDPEHRFFLALLLNLPDQDSILSVIRATYADPDPRARVMKWVTELSGTDVLGVEFDPVNLAIFRRLLEGLSLDELGESLSKEFGAEEVLPQEAQLREHGERIRQLAAFRTLLNVGPSTPRPTGACDP